MLNKYFKNFDENKILICVIIFLVLFVVVGRNVSSVNTNNKDNSCVNEVSNDLKRFDDLSNNYNLDIISKVNGNSYSMTYSRDKNIISSGNDFNFYLKYKDKLYCLEGDKVNICDKYALDEYFIDIFYNINIITNVFKKSRYIEGNKYSFKLSDYFMEYNYWYNKNVKPLDKEINMEVIFDKLSTKFIIDYSEIYKIIYNKDINISYEINLSNINMNNYDDFIKAIDEYND